MIVTCTRLFHPPRQQLKHQMQCLTVCVEQRKSMHEVCLRHCAAQTGLEYEYMADKTIAFAACNCQRAWMSARLIVSFNYDLTTLFFEQVLYS